MNLKPENNQERQWAAVSYLWIFSVVIFLSKQESAFVQHHARRGLILFILSVIIWLIPSFQWGEILILMAMVYGFINAHLGQENSFDVIGWAGDHFFAHRYKNKN